CRRPQRGEPDGLRAVASFRYPVASKKPGVETIRPARVVWRGSKFVAAVSSFRFPVSGGLKQRWNFQSLGTRNRKLETFYEHYYREYFGSTSKGSPGKNRRSHDGLQAGPDRGQGRHGAGGRHPAKEGRF